MLGFRVNITGRGDPEMTANGRGRISAVLMWYDWYSKSLLMPFNELAVWNLSYAKYSFWEQFTESKNTVMGDFSKGFSFLVPLVHCDGLAWKVNFVLTQMHTEKNTYAIEASPSQA